MSDYSYQEEYFYFCGWKSRGMHLHCCMRDGEWENWNRQIILWCYRVGAGQSRSSPNALALALLSRCWPNDIRATLACEFVHPRRRDMRTLRWIAGWRGRRELPCTEMKRKEFAHAINQSSSQSINQSINQSIDGKNVVLISIKSFPLHRIIQTGKFTIYTYKEEHDLMVFYGSDDSNHGDDK